MCSSDLCACGWVAYNVLAFPNAIRPIEQTLYKKSRSADEILTPYEMKADLDSLSNILFAVHPKTAGVNSGNDTTGLVAAFDEAYQKVKVEMPMGRFYYIVKEVMATLEDGHTIPVTPYGESYLRAELAWIGESLYVVDSSFLEPYDEVILIGGVTIKQLYREATRFIAAENEEAERATFIKSIGMPYFLEACGVDLAQLDITVQRGNEQITKPFQMSNIPYNYDQNPSDISYTIDEEASLCPFVLKSCDYDMEYIQLLYGMSVAIKTKEVETLVIDL